MSNVGEIFWSQILGENPNLERERKIRRYVFTGALLKTSHREISRSSRAVTAKKCTKKCNARVELLFWLLRLLLFLTSSLPSPSSLLRLPNLF